MHQEPDFLRTLTVLYVEDDADVRQQLAQFLRRRVGTLVTATNGAEGLEAFKNNFVQMVVTDILMPEMDGLAMAREIRTQNRAIPIVITTAFEQTDYLLRAIDLGVNGYVIKPVNTEKLNQTLRECAHRLYLEEQIRLAATVFDCSPEAIMITDTANRIVSVNQAFSDITGYTIDEVAGRNPRLLASGIQDISFYAHMWNQIRNRIRWQGEIVNRRKDGTLFPAWLTVTTLVNSVGTITHHVGIFSDISARKEAEEQIRHLAMHDPLTGLPNRSLLTARFDVALAQAQRSHRQIALLFVDLDNFKSINDSLGHQAGDQVLKEAARRLLGVFRASDTVSRLGGDEFLVVINSVREQSDALGAAEKALEVMGKEMVIEGKSIRVTPSIGLAIYPEDGTDLEALIKNADSAMYKAKQLGKNSFQSYHPTGESAAVTGPL